MKPSSPETPPGRGRCWKVGELAELTGLTVRTLHHYEAKGLLRPSGRTDSAHGSGHRLYTAADVERLQQILSLRTLGFGLSQIGDYLARADYDPRQVVRRHLDHVRRQSADLERIERRLSSLADALDAAEAVSADDFLATIKEMTMFETYYTPEQLDQIRARREQVGEERIKQSQQEWAELTEEVRAAVAGGVDPADPRAVDLARRWYALIFEFTGGDPGIARSLRTMYENEAHVGGNDVAAMRPLMEFIGRAAEAGGVRTPWN